MMRLGDIKKDLGLVNELDWEITPENAVRRYLEWGGNYSRENYFHFRGQNDITYYFVVNNWGTNPVVNLVKRQSFDMEELAEFRLPVELERSFIKEVGGNKGIYSIEGDVKKWLQKEICGGVC